MSLVHLCALSLSTKRDIMILNHAILLITVFVVSCDCHSKFETYIKDPTFSDQMCPGDQVKFTTVTRSAVSCARTCSDSPGCTSLVYLHDNNTCFGVKSDNPFGASSPLPGAVFYKSSSSTTASTTVSPSTPQSTTAATTATTDVTAAAAATTTADTTTLAATATAEETTAGTSATSAATTATTSVTAATTSTTAAATTAVTSATTITTGTAAETTTTTGQPITTTTAAATTHGTACATIGPLVSGSPGMSDSAITASSHYDNGEVQYLPHFARLDGPKAWAPYVSDTASFIQFDFTTTKTVASIATQGQVSIYSELEFVTTYHVLHSITCVNGSFVTVKGPTGVTQMFTGNTDPNSVVTNAFAPPFLARCVRVNAQTWNLWITLRVELYGC